MKPADLPLFYYHDHFLEMVATVARHYGEIIGAVHRDFIERFHRLSANAQRLFIRLVNRRGHVFHVGKLGYAEIDSAAALEELFANGFLRLLGASDYQRLLEILDKLALLNIGREFVRSMVRSSMAKVELIDLILSVVPYDAFEQAINRGAYVVREHAETLDFMLYLYFGKTDRDLKSFALRDLGIARVNGREASGARFVDAEEAEACYRYSCLLGTALTQATVSQSEALLLGPVASSTPYAAMLRNRLAQHVGRHLEKSGETARALAIYQTADDPACNERHVRLLASLKRSEECRSMLERMIDDPASDAEYDFALEFYARKFGGHKIGACTALLRDSERIEIDEAYRTMAEDGAAAYFAREGWSVFWTESSVWLTLFGLVFWDELFGRLARLHTEFDRLPRCLADRSFCTIYAKSIAARLDRVRQGGAAALIAEIIDQMAGSPQALVNWWDVKNGAVQALARSAPPDALAAMLEMMAADFHAMNDGFPDLMLVRPCDRRSGGNDGHDLRFIEIKGEGDAIRRNQLTRLRQLQRAGFIASICRVDYRFDPTQTYSVVDIETTGSRAGVGRIIEIAVVKMRHHQVIDEWHSLIDPERHVPAFITKLTGISNAMVAGQPKFRDIAGDLSAFMKDTVFVAHSVNFDHGFIASEFRRLDIPFRMPKFCTCAGTRRHAPGHESYSLGALCEAFDIPLERHHRALDDARAAAALLCRINRGREEQAVIVGSINDGGAVRQLNPPVKAS